MTRSFQFFIDGNESKELFATYADAAFAAVRVSIEADSMDAGITVLKNSNSDSAEGATYALVAGDTAVFAGARIRVQSPDGGYVKGTFEIISTHFAS